MQQVRIRLLSNGFLAKMLFVLPFDTGDGRLPPCLTSWCNSDVESVLLCPSARCFLIKFLYVGCCFLYSFFPASRWISMWWWECFFLLFSHHDATQMLGVFCCAPGPGYVLINDWRVTFFLASWCDYDVGSALMCPWTRCVLIWWSICGLLFLHSFFPTSRCNCGDRRLPFFFKSWCTSDVGGVLLCPWAWCVLI